MFDFVIHSRWLRLLAFTWLLCSLPACDGSCYGGEVTFEAGLQGYTQQSSSDDFDWTRIRGPTGSLDTGPSSDHTGNGYYMYIEASSPRLPGETAVLRSPTLARPVSSTCHMTFWYYMYGVAVNTLAVRVTGTNTGPRTLATISGDKGQMWFNHSVAVTSSLITAANFQVLFVGTVGASFYSDIAIDDISWGPGCCATSSCYGGEVTFEAGLQGYTQLALDDFDWTRIRGPTLSDGTGPPGDRTGLGYYMYIEASVPRLRGETAILRSPTLARPVSPTCHMTFWYYMYGATVDTLAVRVNGTSSGMHTLSNITGDQGPMWRNHTVTVSPALVTSSTFQVFFVGTIGTSYTSDIAIDDISWSQDCCSVTARIGEGRCLATVGDPSADNAVLQGSKNAYKFTWLMPHLNLSGCNVRVQGFEIRHNSLEDCHVILSVWTAHPRLPNRYQPRDSFRTVLPRENQTVQYSINGSGYQLNPCEGSFFGLTTQSTSCRILGYNASSDSIGAIFRYQSPNIVPIGTYRTFSNSTSVFPSLRILFQDVDECNHSTPICSKASGTVCVNTNGSYQCQYPFAYCNAAAPTPLCARVPEACTSQDDCPGNCSPDYGLCSEGASSSQCTCDVDDSPVTERPVGCVYVDMCQADTHDCAGTSACVNTTNSFICLNMTGFSSAVNTAAPSAAHSSSASLPTTRTGTQSATSSLTGQSVVVDITTPVATDGGSVPVNEQRLSIWIPVGAGAGGFCLVVLAAIAIASRCRKRSGTAVVTSATSKNALYESRTSKLQLFPDRYSSVDSEAGTAGGDGGDGCAYDTGGGGGGGGVADEGRPRPRLDSMADNPLYSTSASASSTATRGSEEFSTRVLRHQQSDGGGEYSEPCLTSSASTVMSNSRTEYSEPARVSSGGTITSNSHTECYLEPEYQDIPEAGQDSPIYDQLVHKVNNSKPIEDPPYAVGALYSHLRSETYRQLTRDEVEQGNLLGEGEFGVVLRGTLTVDGVTVPVAVKTLKKQNEDGLRSLLQEAIVMGQVHHPNIVRLCGIISGDEKVLVVLELMAKGDLLSYLKRICPIPSANGKKHLPMQLLKFSQDVAAGMTYLESRQFIHRDLAARNIMVNANKTCKIGDFGLSRNLAEEEYYASHGGKIPFRSAAPEALLYRKYSTASDVWSYAVLLYEIYSFGSTPYQGANVDQVIHFVTSDNGRLPPPPGCSRALYQIMIDCWHPVTSLRPTFQTVKGLLKSKANVILTLPAPTTENPGGLQDQYRLGADVAQGEELYPDLQTAYVRQ